MSKTITLEKVYKELRLLRKEMELIKHALIPEEKISSKGA